MTNKNKTKSTEVKQPYTQDLLSVWHEGPGDEFGNKPTGILVISLQAHPVTLLFSYLPETVKSVTLR